ncbi:MAG: hypothetical protein ACHBN1_19630 [Heteroscytonema crispum UTEX LB 1556]
MSQRNEWGRVLTGIFLVFGMHIAAIIIGSVLLYLASVLAIFAMSQILLMAFIFIGVTQLLYVIPLVVILIRQRKWGLMKGVIIGTVITALLNGGCWIFFVNQFSR